MFSLGRSIRLGSTVTALLLVTACSAGNRSAETLAAPVHLAAVPAAEYAFPSAWAGDYTFQWSAADGIDLTGPESTVVRALAESKRLSLSVGDRLAYPGYSQAVSQVGWLHIPDGGSYPAGAREGDWQLRWAGTFLARILQVDPNDHGFTAAYCLDFGNVAESDDGGKSYHWRPTREDGETARGWVRWLNVTAPHGESQATSMPTDTGGPVHRAPRFNVFDGWTVTDAWGPSPQREADTAEADGCTQWTQSNPHAEPPIVTSAEGREPVTPPVAQPPAPGWPVT
ncbi:hypothetical protein [Nocardia sp. NBC_01388]|uniref:hypothetical protein n=1 Tax=Nocardia sp. NBC_01388 TaxID=2903596 RepID=UPI00324FD135